MFRDVPNLRKLYLNENELLNLSPKTFAELKTVTHLNLSKNELTHLGGSMFSGLVSLVDLNLSSNNLEEFGFDCVNECANLTRLDLSYNDFLDRFDLDELKKLKNAAIKVYLKAYGERNGALEPKFVKQFLKNNNLTISVFSK